MFLTSPEFEQLALDDIITELENNKKTVFIAGVGNYFKIGFEDLVHTKKLSRQEQLEFSGFRPSADRPCLSTGFRRRAA